MRAAALAVALGASLSLSGCGGAPRAVTPLRDAAEPHWQDVFDTTPELLLILRPRALRRDKVYGPLLRRAIQAARESSRVMWATPLDAIEDADEVILGVRTGPRDAAGVATSGGEGVVVLRGVRADLDPVRLVDGDGRPLWTAGPGGPVRELLREKDERGNAVDASLFELPGRTWVITAGGARARAREAFAHPLDRPALRLDPDALAEVRFDGPSLLAFLTEHVERLPRAGFLAAVGHKLRSATVELPPALQEPDPRGVIRATLSYLDEESAGVAEIAAADLAGALSRAKASPLSWLGAATVRRAQANLVVTVDLPRAL